MFGETGKWGAAIVGKEEREKEKVGGGSWDRWTKREDEDSRSMGGPRYVVRTNEGLTYEVGAWPATISHEQPRASRWSTNPQLTNGPSDNLCRLTHPVEICLRYTAAFSTTSRGRPFRVLSLLPPFTGRSTRLSAVYRTLPRLNRF